MLPAKQETETWQREHQGKAHVSIVYCIIQRNFNHKMIQGEKTRASSVYNQQCSNT